MSRASEINKFMSFLSIASPIVNLIIGTFDSWRNEDVESAKAEYIYIHVAFKKRLCILAYLV